MKIAVVGLGYVGLPVSLMFTRAKVFVLGLDTDQTKVEAIKAGKSYIKHISSDEIKEQIKHNRLQPSTDFNRINEVDAVLICVPTPLKNNREPDLSFVLKTGETIAPQLKKNSLVVLESTTYPGTTDYDLRTVLEVGSGMIAGKDFHLAYSPEREDPGNTKNKATNIPKIVGGYTESCRKRAEELYSIAVDNVVPVSSCRVAEATKLLENIYRCVNIAMVNELKQVYAAMDIDIWEVIEAAKTKPFGYMPFYPGPGLGGHCIPVDPFYLTWKAQQYGKVTRFIKLAGEINTLMPEYVINIFTNALKLKGKNFKGSNILVIGIAYKQNIDDDRESPGYVLMDKLKDLGAEVSYFDPYIPEIKSISKYPCFRGKKSIQWKEKIIRDFDGVLISTAHRKINYQELADWSELIIDTRNAMKGFNVDDNKIWKA